MTRFNKGDAWFFHRFHGMDDSDDHDGADEREEEEPCNEDE